MGRALKNILGIQSHFSKSTEQTRFFMKLRWDFFKTNRLFVDLRLGLQTGGKGLLMETTLNENFRMQQNN